MAEIETPDNHLPALTLGLVLASLVVFLLPAASHALIYDCDLIHDGEVWRLLTYMLVHLSWQHLGYNALVLLVTGWLVERLDRLQFVVMLVATALLSSLYVLLFVTEMKYFAGMSGVVSALLVFLCVVNIGLKSPTRWIWFAILVLFVLKISYEMTVEQALFVSSSSGEIRVVPSAHIIGALVGIFSAVLFLNKAIINQQQ